MDTNFYVKNRLVEFGVKPSLQRIAIMEYLMNHLIHPTADMVFSNLYPFMPTLSKTTVYNTLNLLEKQGVIRAIRIDEKNVRYDADISEHAHFKCKLCGEIHDLKVKGIGNLEPDNSKNFLITEYQMYYSGFCDKCAEYKTISVN